MYSKMENVSDKQSSEGGRDLFCDQMLCFMNVKGCFQKVGFMLVLDAHRQPTFCSFRKSEKAELVAVGQHVTLQRWTRGKAED